MSSPQDKANSNLDWWFYGYLCTSAEAAKLKAKADKGICPFCSKQMDKRYRGDKRHMGACAKNPANKGK